jgi:feruloyl esterase
MIAKAVMDECDASDGATDGLIADPRSCSFDPQSLQCKAGNEDGSCLTKAEIGVLKKWYGGLPDGHGVDWKYNIAFGSEPYWPTWLTPPAGRKGVMEAYLDNLFSYVLFERDPGPSYSLHDFDLKTYPKALDFMRELYRADNPDLSRFRAAGGKAIMWQGWSDPGAVPGAAIGYYEDVVEHAGGIDQADRFFRLFMVPGAGHCFEAPHQSAERFDPIAALEAWVEREIAPDAIIARQVDVEGATVRASPLCRFPQIARYSGEGDVNDAGNFTCEE